MRVETPDAEYGHAPKGPAILLCTRSRVSLLTGGGGASLNASGSAQTTANTSSGAPVTVYNGASGPMSQKTMLIIGGLALGALLLIGLLFRGRN